MEAERDARIQAMQEDLNKKIEEIKVATDNRRKLLEEEFHASIENL